MSGLRANLFTKLLRNTTNTLFIRVEPNTKSSYVLFNSSLFARGIKKYPKKKDKRDGHHVNPRDYYWEQRMKHAPKSPLATEPINIIKETSSSKKTTTFSTAEKRLGVVAIITMLSAVISFKLVFGNKEARPIKKPEAITEELQDTNLDLSSTEKSQTGLHLQGQIN